MRQRFLQTEFVDSKFTIIVAFVVAVLCWAGLAMVGSTPTVGVPAPLWYDHLLPTLSPWASKLLGFVGYFMAYYIIFLRNRMFAFVRTGTLVQASLFLLYISVYPAIQWVNPGLFLLLLVNLAAFILLYTYQHHSPQGCVFHVFLLLGVGTLVYPSSVVLIPMFWLGLIFFNSWTARSFTASILGCTFPYGVLFAYAYYYHNLQFMLPLLQEMTTFYPVDWALFSISQLCMFSFAFVVYVISMLHILMHSHHFKIRTRASLRFLMLLGATFLLLIALQPIHCDVYMPLLLLVTALMAGFVFVTTVNKLTNFVFLSMLAALLFIYLLNLWIH